MLKIAVLEPKDFSRKALKELKKLGKVFLYKKGNIKKFIKNKDILFVRLKYYIGRDILKNSKVKIICSPTTGYNHIDIDYLTKKNIKYISLKGEYDFLSQIKATPEHTFGLVLSLLRNYHKIYCKNLDFKDRDKYKGEEINGKVVGIIGFGRVGKQVAKYFEVFGAKVIYNDIEKKSKKYEFLSKKDLIKKSDIIILSAFYSKENNNMIDKKLLKLMKDKYFINTARGELVDEKYLLKLAKKRYFKGIALDVLKNETSNHNLKKFKKLGVLITPHISGATYESMYKTEEFIVKKLKENL